MTLLRSRAAAGDRLDPPGLRKSIVAGVVAALLLATALGTAFALNRPAAAWSSEVSLVVRPAANLSDASKAGYYENLSSGQVVQTYAEVLRSSQLGGVDADGESAAEILVVPDTFLLRIVLESTTRELAISRGEQIGTEAVAAIGALGQPYELRLVGAASDNVQEIGGLDLALLAVAAVCAVLYGVGVQQLVWFLQRRGHARRTESSGHVPVAGGRAVGVPSSLEQPTVR